jgi:hypothetical protein
VNAFLRNIERIRLAEREEALAETRGVVLEKARGIRPASGMTPEEAARRHRDRMRERRAAEVAAAPKTTPQDLARRALELRDLGWVATAICQALGIKKAFLPKLIRDGRRLRGVE